jgi:hypothetical protein
MKRMSRVGSACALGWGMVAGMADVGHASVTIFTDYDAWSAAIGGTDATIDFVLGSPPGQITPLTDQYGHFGVQFAPGYTVAGPHVNAPDGWIAHTTFLNQMVIDYDIAQAALAVKTTTPFTAKLYLGGIFVLETPLISAGVFRGFTLGDGLQFDRAILAQGPNLGYAIDDLYVATPIPSAGGALVVAGMIGCVRGRGRRRLSA